MGFLIKLQQKPAHIRTAIMWLAVFICMAIIVSVWAWSFDRSVKLAKEEQRPQAENPFKELKEEVPSLWQSLGAGIKNIFSDLSEKIAPLAEIEEELSPAEDLESPEPELDQIKPGQLPEVE